MSIRRSSDSPHSEMTAGAGGEITSSLVKSLARRVKSHAVHVKSHALRDLDSLLAMTQEQVSYEKARTFLR